MALPAIFGVYLIWINARELTPETRDPIPRYWPLLAQKIDYEVILFEKHVDTININGIDISWFTGAHKFFWQDPLGNSSEAAISIFVIFALITGTVAFAK